MHTQDSRPSHKSVMLTQTVFLFVTYSCNGFNFEHFFISVSKMYVQFQGCWHKKQEPLCMIVINSNEKNLIYNFGNDFYFQNEEFCLQLN